MAYTETLFTRGGETATAKTWLDHWQLIWEGWTPGDEVPETPDLNTTATKQYVIDAIEDAEVGGGGTPYDDTALVAAIATKADTGHTHSIAAVTGLQAALDGKIAAGDVAVFDLLADEAAYAAIVTKGPTTLYLIPE